MTPTGDKSLSPSPTAAPASPSVLLASVHISFIFRVHRRTYTIWARAATPDRAERYEKLTRPQQRRDLESNDVDEQRSFIVDGDGSRRLFLYYGFADPRHTWRTEFLISSGDSLSTRCTSPPTAATITRRGDVIRDILKRASRSSGRDVP